MIFLTDIDYGGAISLNSLCMVDGINVSSSSVEKITHLKENEGVRSLAFIFFVVLFNLCIYGHFIIEKIIINV